MGSVELVRFLLADCRQGKLAVHRVVAETRKVLDVLRRDALVEGLLLVVNCLVLVPNAQGLKPVHLALELPSEFKQLEVDLVDAQAITAVLVECVIFSIGRVLLRGILHLLEGTLYILAYECVYLTIKLLQFVILKKQGVYLLHKVFFKQLKYNQEFFVF